MTCVCVCAHAHPLACLYFLVYELYLTAVPIVAQNLVLHKQLCTIPKLISFCPPIPNLPWWGHPCCHYCVSSLWIFPAIGSHEENLLHCLAVCDTPITHTFPIRYSLKHFGSERSNKLIFRYIVLMFMSLRPGEQGPHSTRAMSEEGKRESIVHAWRWPTINPDKQPGAAIKEQQPTNISQPALSFNISLCTRTWLVYQNMKFQSRPVPKSVSCTRKYTRDWVCPRLRGKTQTFQVHSVVFCLTRLPDDSDDSCWKQILFMYRWLLIYKSLKFIYWIIFRGPDQMDFYIRYCQQETECQYAGIYEVFSTF